MKQSNKKGSEWGFGIHSVQALLKTSSERVQRLYLLQSRKDQRLTKLIALAEKQEVSFEFLPREELDKLIENSGGSDFDDQDINHQGAIAQCSPGKVHDEAFLNELLDGLTEDPLLLVLDGVTDPMVMDWRLLF